MKVNSAVKIISLEIVPLKIEPDNYWVDEPLLLVLLQQEPNRDFFDNVKVEK
jgi:uncharacterized GH25 family protein